MQYPILCMQTNFCITSQCVIINKTLRNCTQCMVSSWVNSTVLQVSTILLECYNTSLFVKFHTIGKQETHESTRWGGASTGTNNPEWNLCELHVSYHTFYVIAQGLYINYVKERLAFFFQVSYTLSRKKKKSSSTQCNEV